MKPALYDNLIYELSNKELKAYFNENRYKTSWKQENEVRSYNYIVLNISPTARGVTVFWRMVRKPA